VQLANEPEPIIAPAPLVEPAAPIAVEPQTELTPAAAEAPTSGETVAPIPEASSPLVRAAYVLIFLLTVLASYTVWPQAGGQGHLDLMPWYWKLFPPFAFSYAVVRASIAAGSAARAWNRQAITWFLAAIACASLIGGLTYYYHLTESQDQVDSDDGIMTSVQAPDRQPHA